MHRFVEVNGRTQILIPLRIKPFHAAVPTVTGSAFSFEAGTVLFGHYSMDYLLPDGDRLRLIANHNKKTVQLLLFTHNPELLQQLPGKRESSLVADSISRLNRYRILSSSYNQPLTKVQKNKLRLANTCIQTLQELLALERQLQSTNHYGHEQLRIKVLAILDACANANRMLANNPVISEGNLGVMLYDAYKAAQQFQFNRVHPISPQDQMDFADPSTHNNKESPCFVWDSEVHIGHNSYDLDDALRAISQAYGLKPARSLNNVPANRFEKFENFFYQLWLDGKDWIEYLSAKKKPKPEIEINDRLDGISVTKISPYYKLHGFKQKGYPSLDELISNFCPIPTQKHEAQSEKEAQRVLNESTNGHWAVDPLNKKIILRLNDQLVAIHYFIHDELFYPLPDGDDLYSLSQVSKRHLYLPERVSLKLQAFASKIPVFFHNFFTKLRGFIVHDLYEDFVDHVHEGHQSLDEEQDNEPDLLNAPFITTLHSALEEHGLLNNGQTLEDFIKEHLEQSPYVIARANHPPSPHHYDNPFHRALTVFRHFAGFFIDTCERNPLVGSLSIAAYFFGAGAVIAPKTLEALLVKLHLNGLISAIEPVQKIARFMSHGTIPETISASVTMWQSVIAGGNLDKFFVNAITVVKDDPAEIAIIITLALSFGFSITRIIPSLRDEMGRFPLPNYAALGGKGGAAVYDTIMHPGDDWLLGTCKWLSKIGITLGKLVIAPFIEGYHYGAKKGLLSGFKKSARLASRLLMQVVAASLDLFLAVLTIPLIEVSAMLIHVPFRGITTLIRKCLATLGNITPIGQSLIQFAHRPALNNFLSQFQWSTLYGFSSPLGKFSANPYYNLLLNCLRILFIPPLQLIKNVIILPLIDITSLLVRIGLSIANPLTRLLAYGLGTLIINVGQLWDNSFGLVFSLSAQLLTYFCNALDTQLGFAKQYLLSAITIIREHIYQWAFAAEDAKFHVELHDEEYYTSQPDRCEKIPHSASHCLLNTLLTVNNQQQLPASVLMPEPHHEGLFNFSVQDEVSQVDRLNCRYNRLEAH